MKIERTVVIATLSVIVGLGVIGVSPAFAGENPSLPLCSRTVGVSEYCFDIVETAELYYLGGLKDELPHGQGYIKFSDGNEYNGDWKDGKQHGQGTLTLADGREYVGGWMDGVFVGQASLSYILQNY